MVSVYSDNKHVMQYCMLDTKTFLLNMRNNSIDIKKLASNLLGKKYS